MRKLYINKQLIHEELERRNENLSQFERRIGFRRGRMCMILTRRRANFESIERIANGINRAPKDILI